jgi:hypothetical protein
MMKKQKLKPIPKFGSEAEERAFWEDESNDTTEYVDWSKAKRVAFPNLQPSVKDRLSRNPLTPAKTL